MSKGFGRLGVRGAKRDRRPLDEIVNSRGGVLSTSYLRTGFRDYSTERVEKQFQGMSSAQAEHYATHEIEPVTLSVWPGQYGRAPDVSLEDGRHRSTIAKRHGATHIRAHIDEFDTKGSVIRSYDGVVKL